MNQVNHTQNANLNILSHPVSGYDGQIPALEGDQNLEMAPAPRKRLVINKKLNKFVRLEHHIHGPSKLTSKESNSKWKVVDIPKTLSPFPAPISGQDSANLSPETNIIQVSM